MKAALPWLLLCGLLTHQDLVMAEHCDCCPCPCYCKCEEPDNCANITSPTTEPPLTEPPAPSFSCSEQCLDLGFIIDSTSSISPANYAKVKQFLKGIVKSFKISNSLTQTAVVQFANNLLPWLPRERVEWDYSDQDINQDLASLEAAIDEMKQINGFTFTVDGWKLYLNDVLPTLRTTPPDGCSQLTHVVIFFTDGRNAKGPPSALSDAAQELLDETDNLVYGVGVNENENLNKPELWTLAGSPDRVIVLDKFTEMVDAVDELVNDKICKDLKARQPKMVMVPPLETETAEPAAVVVPQQTRAKRECYCCCPPFIRL